jgi:hypothetical protein
VNRERQSPYALAFCLLLAGAIPELAWTADTGFTADFVKPTPSAEAFGPQLARSAVFFPAAAGLLALFLASSMPRWLRGLGFATLGAVLIVLPANRAGVAAAFNGQFGAPPPWDLLLVGGIALAFVATRAQADSSPGLPLSLFAGLGGLAVLAWLLVPRGVSAADGWLGLVSRDHPDTMPIARGFLRNGEFAAGTHPLRYLWWNVTLAALVVFPLLCLRVPTRRREWRAGTADAAYGALVFVLLSVALSSVVAAALGDQFKPGFAEDGKVAWQPLVVAAANAARLLFPPLLLAGLALIGVSDLFKSVSAVRVPKLALRLPKLRLPKLPKISVLPPMAPRRAAVPPPQIPPEPAAARRPGRVRMATDAYGNPERV